MSSVSLSIKHAGKTYGPIEVDLSSPATELKSQIYSLTGVEPSKQKVVVKGGMLKDETDLNALGFKEGQILTVIGTAGPLPKAPEKKIVFMEDMSDQELAKALKLPVGLINLGNTCYMNSTLQVLFQIPELKSSLLTSPISSPSNPKASTLVQSMKLLFKNLDESNDGFAPFVFLKTLRDWNPQFGEHERSQVAGIKAEGYAQQDAEECYSSILSAVRQSLPSTSSDSKKWIEEYMEGEVVTTTKSDEAPDEEGVISKERFLELKCNISVNTNYMTTGISETLVSEIEKISPTLGRNAIYKQESRINRLPSWLSVHLVRFYWRREISKKAKIMRKVKFPFEYDVLDLLTPELKEKIKPLNEKLKLVERDRRERTKIRGKVKRVKEEKEKEKAEGSGGVEGLEGMAAAAGSGSKRGKVDPRDLTSDLNKPAQEAEKDKDDMDVDKKEKDMYLTLEEEKAKRAQEDEELKGLVCKELLEDRGANYTGIYELYGIVTHKGASADGGHYVAWCRSPPSPEEEYDQDPDKEEWLCYDDEKVYKVPREKVAALDGGGEDHTAYILLYRGKTL